MTEVARAAGLTREALYKALRPSSQQGFETIAPMLGRIGGELTVSVDLITQVGCLVFGQGPYKFQVTLEYRGS